MTASIERENTSSPLDHCTIVVIYDDPFTRARALNACDYFVSQMWENVELDFHWWRTDFLSDAIMSQAAAHYAISADFLIVCSSGTNDLSHTLATWAERWLPQRGKREGVLIDLSVTSDVSSQSPQLQTVLRAVAKRGNFDYLTPVEPRPRGAETRLSTPSISNDHVRDRSHPPSHFGLNE